MRTRPIVTLIAVVLLVVVGIALTAKATTCETFTNHSGQVPDGWTATFIEDGQTYGPYVGPTYVDPETSHEGNRSWDKAKKCRTVTTTTEATTTTTVLDDTTTTTTSESSSTTTTEPTPTSTLPSASTTLAPTTTSPPTSTSTTLPASTTSQPGTTSELIARAYCEGDDGFIEATWGEGIAGVDVYMWISGLPGIESDWSFVSRWLEPGVHPTDVGGPTSFLLIPIVTGGHTAAERIVEIGACVTVTSQASSTSAPEAPEAPETPETPSVGAVDELPYTGPGQIVGLIALASALIGGGG